MSSWVKLHTDILGDVKLMRAARKGATDLELTPWLIAFAKLAEDGGRLTVGGEAADPEDIAALIPGIEAARVASCMIGLQAAGILERETDGVLRFAAWERRAEAKPSDSKEAIRQRVTAHRERTRRAKPSETPCNAPPETPCNALQGSEGNATEVEVEGEEEIEKEPPTSLARDRLLGRFREPDTWTAVDRFLTAAEHAGTNPEFWILEIGGWLDGLNMPHLTPAAEIDVAQALRDYLAQVDPDFSPVHVRQFPARAARARQRAEKREIPFAGSGDRDAQLAEAAQIVQQIRDLAEDVPVQAGGLRRVLRNAAIDQLGPEIAAAFRNAGGGARFLETAPDKLGLLHRDFAVHLAAARRRLAPTTPSSEIAHV